MQKFSYKSAWLLAAAVAVCAFALPSAASAASWSPVGLETTFDSPDLGFTATSAGAGTTVTSCNGSTFTADVRSASVLTITSATFGRVCVASFPSLGADCTLTTVGTNFPWTATAPATNNIQLHGVVLDVRYENTPGSSSCSSLGLTGASVTITGTLSGGNWTGNVSREIILSNAEGLTVHGSSLIGGAITLRGTLFSTGNLQVLP